MENNTINILKLLSIKGVGPAKIKSVLNNAEAHLNEYEKSGKIDHNWVDSVISSCENTNTKIIPYTSKEYPQRLLGIKDFPIILYCIGNISLLNTPRAVSIVGTRKASDYGKRAAHRIALNLSSDSFTIVSGMALGIDREAHLGALDACGQCIVVLASGPDKPTPTSNADIYQRVLESNGVIISEHEPGFPVVKTELVKRNRIQSGLSTHTIIIETGETGGTITQAKYAVEQKKNILTMVENENSPTSFNCDYSGSNRLLAEFGAKGFKSWEELADHIRSDLDINDDNLLI